MHAAHAIIVKPIRMLPSSKGEGNPNSSLAPQSQSSRASSSSGRRSLPPPSFDQLARDIEAASKKIKTLLGESFFCTALGYKKLFLQGLRKCRPWRNSIFCTVLRFKMLLVQCLHQCRPWTNSSFCTVLRYKMLLVQAVHKCTPIAFARFCATKRYSSSAYINVGTGGIVFPSPYESKCVYINKHGGSHRRSPG